MKSGYEMPHGSLKWATIPDWPERCFLVFKGWRRVNRASGQMSASGIFSGSNRQGDISPNRHGQDAKLAMIGSSEMFSMKLEKIGNLTVG